MWACSVLCPAAAAAGSAAAAAAAGAGSRRGLGLGCLVAARHRASAAEARRGSRRGRPQLQQRLQPQPAVAAAGPPTWRAAAADGAAVQQRQPAAVAACAARTVTGEGPCAAGSRAGAGTHRPADSRDMACRPSAAAAAGRLRASWRQVARLLRTSAAAARSEASRPCCNYI